ncbi:MAG: addiction module protein [Chloroflexota bacterium]
MNADQLEAEALQFSTPERARLAERLTGSLDREADHEQAGARDVERRLAELQTGQVQTIPTTDVIAEAGARLQ